MLGSTASKRASLTRARNIEPRRPRSPHPPTRDLPESATLTPLTTSPYRWITRLGTGSTGEVWGAEREGREIAVKLIRSRPGSAHAETLLREMRLGPMLAGHPNIVAVNHVESVEGVMHLEMEWVRGPSLAAVLYARARAGKGPLPPKVAVHWARSILEALDWAGSHVAPSQPSSFVHRDIKPANLLLDPSGEVRITDFGVARAEVELGFATTNTGIVKGSPRYMAPEVLAERHVDARADQFSLGAVLYELLTGETLYTSRDLANTLIEALEANVEPRLDAWGGPLRLKKSLRTMLAKDPGHRYTNHRVAAESLGALRLEGPSLAEILPDLLTAEPLPVTGDLAASSSPRLSELPDLSSASAPTSSLTDDVLLDPRTSDVPSLDLELDMELLFAESDRGDTVPLKHPMHVPERGGRSTPEHPGHPPESATQTRPLFTAELAAKLLENDDSSVTAPIAHGREDDEETEVKSMEDIARELGMLDLVMPDENTVTSVHPGEPENSTTGTDLVLEADDDRTAILINVAAPPPPRPGFGPPAKRGLAWWTYAGVGCLVLIASLTAIAIGTAVGLYLASD